MKRLKSLGAAAFVTLCMAAIPSGASAAGGFVADSVYASLHGVGSPHKLTIEAGGGVAECAAYGNATLEKPSEFISITESINCQSGAVGETKLKMNGCEFRLHPGSSSFDIGPVGCKPIEATVSGNCPLTIGAQTGLPASFENTGSGSTAAVNIKFNATNAKYTLLTSGLCGSKGAHEGLRISTENWVEGASNGSSSTGFYAYAGSLPNGIYLTESVESYLVAQVFPGIITGALETSPATVFQAKVSPVKATCAAATFSNELASPAHSDLPLGASFTGCNFGAFGAATVAMNSCHYSLGEFKLGGGLYSGQSSIGCSKAGDTITVSGSGCSIAIPAQSLGSESVALSNVGQGVHATVGAHLLASNVSYTATGVLCNVAGFKKGVQTDGIIDLGVSLSASLSSSVINHG